MCNSMSSKLLEMALIFYLAFSLLLQGALGFTCEELPMNFCTFSVSTSGNRCILDSNLNDGMMLYQCITSEVVVEDKKLHQYIETEECVSACGVDRLTIDTSSDFLIMSEFTAKLCSPGCFNTCFNIVGLYSNLALVEGIHLSDVCEPRKPKPEPEPKKFEPKESPEPKESGAPRDKNKNLGSGSVHAPSPAQS